MNNNNNSSNKYGFLEKDRQGRWMLVDTDVRFTGGRPVPSRHSKLDGSAEGCRVVLKDTRLYTGGIVFVDVEHIRSLCGACSAQDSMKAVEYWRDNSPEELQAVREFLARIKEAASTLRASWQSGFEKILTEKLVEGTHSKFLWSCPRDVLSDFTVERQYSTYRGVRIGYSDDQRNAKIFLELVPVVIKIMATWDKNAAEIDSILAAAPAPFERISTGYRGEIVGRGLRLFVEDGNPTLHFYQKSESEYLSDDERGMRTSITYHPIKHEGGSIEIAFGQEVIKNYLATRLSNMSREEHNKHRNPIVLDLQEKLIKILRVGVGSENK
jgi:hypothetical protein